MRLSIKPAYSAKATSGRRFPVRPVLFLLISSLLIAAFIVLSGCNPGAPTSGDQPTKPGTSGPANTTIPSTQTATAILRAPILLPLRITPSLSAKGMLLNIQGIIRNPNAEKLELDNITISTLHSTGSSLTQDTFPGGSLEASTSTIYDFNIIIPINLLTEKTLSLVVDTRTINTVNPFQVKSTTPISISETLDKLIVHPPIDLQVSISKISQIGLETSLATEVAGTINNPNPVDLNFTRLGLQIKDKNGILLQSAYIDANSIPANSNYKFKSTFLLPLNVLNQTGLTAYASSSVQFLNYAGSIGGMQAFPIPKLSSLVSVPQMTISVNEDETRWITYDSDKIYLLAVTCELPNNNEFPLTTEDFKMNVYKNSDNTTIDSDTLLKGIIEGIPAGGTRTIYMKFDLFQDKVGDKSFEALITGDTKIGIAGASEKIPVCGQLIYKIPRFVP
jgi:hypothetical protein